MRCKVQHRKGIQAKPDVSSNKGVSTQDLSSKAHSLCYIFSSMLLPLVSRQALHHHSSMPVDVLYDAVLDPAAVHPLPWILQCSWSL